MATMKFSHPMATMSFLKGSYESSPYESFLYLQGPMSLRHPASTGWRRLMPLYRQTQAQHTATHCNTLQHTATHCNTLQHTATHCNTLPVSRQTQAQPVKNHISTHCRHWISLLRDHISMYCVSCLSGLCVVSHCHMCHVSLSYESCLIV